MLAFVFPGQGAQSVGAGKDVAAEFEVARRVWEEADEVLGFGLSKLCFYGPARQLTRTENAQPAILSVSVAAARVLASESDLRPRFHAGHSLGEYSALVCARALSFADALRLVRKRGEFMQNAVPEGQGAMAAIMGVAAADIETWCREASTGGIVSPSNYNAPIQTVVSGDTAAVARVVEIARAQDTVAKRLDVSAPFHCALMEPAAQKLASELDDVPLRPPIVPVICNVDGRPKDDPEEIRRLLVDQVTAPVQWERCVRTLASAGVDEIIEIGYGRTLKALIRRIDKKAFRVRAAGTADELRQIIGSTPQESSSADSAEPMEQKLATPLEIQFFGDEPWTTDKNGWKVNKDRTKILFPDGTSWDFHDPKAHLF